MFNVQKQNDMKTKLTFRLLLAMKKSFLLLLLIFCKVSLAQSFEIVGNDSINRIDENNLRQVFWQILNKIKKLPGYKDDQKVEEGNYADSKKTGIWKQFFATGKVKNEITFANNRPSGYAKMYYENGNIMEEGQWENNRWTGEYKQYYENGTLYYDWKYSNQGKREGDQKYFHQNGKVMIEGNWADGKENGVIKEYYDDGSLKAEKVFNGGTIDLAASKEYSEKGKIVSPSLADTKPDPIVETRPAKTETPKVEEKAPVKVVTTTTTSGSGTDLISDGFHKIYNKNKQVDREGTFKDSRFFEGKQYEYEGSKIIKTIYYENYKISKVELTEDKKP